jgi:hypothetical protein
MKGDDMTRTHPLRLITILAGLGGCTTEPGGPPAMPSYETHVKPILVAHCVRCHGAGDMLNGESVDGDVINVATGGYFDHYEDRGNCNPDGGIYPPDCKLGAHTYAVPPYVALTNAYLHPPTELDARMPPPPAAPLSANELLTVDRWLANPIP